MQITLIDADIIAWQIANRHETAIEFKPGLFTWWADMNKAQPEIESSVHEILNNTNSDDLIVCLSDTNNFRKQINPTYKANRIKRYTPLLVQPIKDYLEQNWRSVHYPQLEADDVLGILATDKSEDSYVIASIDKDLLQIPGKHFNWTKPEEGIQEVTPEEGSKFFYTQILSGDPGDGYAGCKGIGPVKAKRIIDSTWDQGESILWRTICKTYAKAHNCSLMTAKRQALIQDRCALILTRENYSPKSGRLKLWEPQSERK